MAVPTPSTWSRTSGHKGVTFWNGVWGGAGDFTATAIVDLSTLNYTNMLKILSLDVSISKTIKTTFAISATSNQYVLYLAGGTAENTTIHLDFSDCPDGGIVKTEAGGEGDFVLTTSGGDTGMYVSIKVNWECY